MHESPAEKSRAAEHNHRGHHFLPQGRAKARKETGAAIDFTPTDRQWLEEAMRLIIRGASELPSIRRLPCPQITMANLSPLL